MGVEGRPGVARRVHQGSDVTAGGQHEPGGTAEELGAPVAVLPRGDVVGHAGHHVGVHRDLAEVDRNLAADADAEARVAQIIRRGIGRQRAADRRDDEEVAVPVVNEARAIRATFCDQSMSQGAQGSWRYNDARRCRSDFCSH